MKNVRIKYSFTFEDEQQLWIQHKFLALYLKMITQLGSILLP